MIDALELGHEAIREIAALVEELARQGRQAARCASTPPDGRRRLCTTRSRASATRVARGPATPGQARARSDALDERQGARASSSSDGRASPTRRRWRSARRPSRPRSTSSTPRSSARRSSPGGAPTAARTTRSARSRSCRTSSRAQHGSALFTRGETQALVTRHARHAGRRADHRRHRGGVQEAFYLHYNFPPYSRRRDAPHRRARAGARSATACSPSARCRPCCPPRSASPTRSASSRTSPSRTARSSMASVCGGCLVDDARRRAALAARRGHRHGPRPGGRARRDPLRHPRLRGPPRRHGLQGRRLGLGITALQMDIKIKGVTRELLERALEQAREGRMHILQARCSRSCRARRRRSPSTRRAWRRVQIPPEKIGFLIGPGGKNIKAMQEQYKVQASRSSTTAARAGRPASTRERVQACVDAIQAHVRDAEDRHALHRHGQERSRTSAPSSRSCPGVEGLCHISELAEGYVDRVTRRGQRRRLRSRSR